jgi:hypothetical protein
MSCPLFDGDVFPRSEQFHHVMSLGGVLTAPGPVRARVTAYRMQRTQKKRGRRSIVWGLFGSARFHLLRQLVTSSKEECLCISLSVI